MKRLSWVPGKRVRLLSDDQGPSFTPDGRHIVFTRSSGGLDSKGEQVKNSDIVVMDLDGENRRIVVRAPQYKADYEYASFSPDGSKLVYEHRRAQSVDRQSRRALVVSSADGQRRQRLTPWSLNAGDSADWSPDGMRILFRSYEDEDEGDAVAALHDPSGRNRPEAAYEFPGRNPPAFRKLLAGRYADRLRDGRQRRQG